jgi:hypothetical protein
MYLVSLFILSFGDIFYLYLTNNINLFFKNKILFFIFWIVISLGVQLIILNNEGEYDDIKKNNAQQGFIYGFIIYMIFYYFIDFKSIIYEIAYGSFLVSFTTMYVYIFDYEYLLNAN